MTRLVAGFLAGALTCLVLLGSRRVGRRLDWLERRVRL